MSKTKILKIRQNAKVQLHRIEDIPLIALNVKILKFLAFIFVPQTWRRILTIIPIIMLNLTQCCQLYYGEESADAKIRNGFLSMLLFNSHLRAMHVCFKRREYEKFLEYLKELYVELREMQDKEIQFKLDVLTEKTQKLSKYNLIIGYLVCVGMALYPLFAKERILVFSVYVPFVDVYQNPWYQLVYFCHISLTPLGASMFIPFTALVVTFMLFAMLMCQVLQLKLKNLKNFPIQEIHAEVIWCIKYQLKVIRFVDSINSLHSWLFLVEYIFYGTMLCTLLFSMIISTTFIQMLILIVYITMIFTQSFLMYFYATELYEESAAVANAAYDVNWFDCNVATQKTLKLLILRSQKSNVILLGNVYPMNLRKLQSLLNATYSFYTLLKRLYG